MHLFKAPADLDEFLSDLRSRGRSIGLVPTMGALHQGHLSLIQHSQADNNETVVSIFVNPTQFNNPEDLRLYPREPEKDVAQIEEKTSCRMVFLPGVEDLYPQGVRTDKIDLGYLAMPMEGRHRPGHFAGVATVVKRLLELVKPNRAYFGEKDFQQLAVIRQLQKILNLPVEIIGHPIERDEKGLAMSSRNKRLSEEDREKALIIIENLKWAAKNYSRYEPAEIKKIVEQNFKSSPVQLIYVEITDEENLRPIDRWHAGQHTRIFIAAEISGVRLIDNHLLF